MEYEFDGWDIELMWRDSWGEEISIKIGCKWHVKQIVRKRIDLI